VKLANSIRERLTERENSELNPNKPKSVFIHARKMARNEGTPWRPYYGFSVANAAVSARRLGLDRVSALEFGVAGGNGLLALEASARHVEQLIGVKVEVYGFDTGEGLPAPTDPRDAPFLFTGGQYAMDQDALRARLERAELRLGLIGDTIGAFLAEDHAPVGFASFDVDYYTSTMDAFALLDGPPERLLPRVSCYFDDVLLYPWTDFNGERLAIRDFNDAHEQRKIAQIHGLRWWLPKPETTRLWPDQIYVAELFDHPLYTQPEADTDLGTLGLRG
jgi:hypothetical protein